MGSSEVLLRVAVKCTDDGGKVKRAQSEFARNYDGKYTTFVTRLMYTARGKKLQLLVKLCVQ